MVQNCWDYFAVTKVNGLLPPGGGGPSAPKGMYFVNTNSPDRIVHCNQGLAELPTEMHVRTAAMRLIFLHLRRNALNFVQRSAKLLQRGIASAQPALPLPFLGVSSLNLGRLDFPDGLFFLPRFWQFRNCCSADFYSADRALGGDVGARKARSIRARRATNSPMSRVRRLRPAARVTRASSMYKARLISI